MFSQLFVWRAMFGRKKNEKNLKYTLWEIEMLLNEPPTTLWKISLYFFPRHENEKHTIIT